MIATMRRSWFCLLFVLGCGPAPAPDAPADPKQSACASDCQQRQAACMSAVNVSLSDSGADRRCTAQANRCLNHCPAH